LATHFQTSLASNYYYFLRDFWEKKTKRSKKYSSSLS
jgi:hypothetical protein